MGRHVEVAGVHDVSVLAQGVAYRGHEVTVVVGGSHNDNGVRVVRPDDGNNFLGVLADLRPCGLAVGFIADLVDDIGAVRVFGRNPSEELLSLVHVLVGVIVFQGMPVNQCIHVGRDGRIDACVQRFHGGGSFLGIDAGIIIRIEGQTNQVGIPLGGKLLEKRFIHIFGEPLQSMRADATQLHRVALRVDERTTLDCERAGRGWTCHRIVGRVIVGCVIGPYLRDEREHAQ